MNTTLGKLFIPQPKSKIKAKEGLEVGDYKFFTSSSAQNKFLNDYQYDEESLIFGTGGAASIHYCNEPFSTSTDCIVVYGNGNANLKMVYYYLSGQIHLLQDGFKGAGLQHISKNYILNIPIDLPDRSAQDKIVEIFDIVTQIIKILNNKLKLLDQLVKSRFLEMFGDPFDNPLGWQKLKIQKAVTVKPQNGIYKPQSDYVTDGSGIPILRIDSFYNGEVTNYKKLKRLICNDNEKQRYLLRENDIVINRVNSIEYLGKCAYISRMTEDTVYESNMMRMHFDETRFDSVYISKLLCSKYIYNQIMNHAKKAVNQASINQKDVLDFDIYQPPLKLQTQFAAFVQEIDKSKLAVKECLKKTEYLKASLMQEYFG